MERNPKHFKGKDAVGHVAEAQARGIIARSESHSEELPGTFSAAMDALRDTVVAVLFLWVFLIRYEDFPTLLLPSLLVFGLGWLIWRAGRSAWLGWARIERLHRILEEEKWEIEHNREQEKEELKALYAAKGFQGKLLDDVIEVLMADGDRLLRVMVEEELGLSLEVQEHPLQQAFGAAMGAFIALFCAAGAFWLAPSWGLPVASFLLLGIAAGISSWYENNRLIPAIVWALGVGAIAYGAVFFLLDLIKGK